MIVETEIHHRADAVVPRRRGVSKVLFRSTVRVEIPEIGSDAAPVVLEHPVLGGRIRRVRSVGGLFYAPYETGSLDVDPPEAASSLVASHLAWTDLAVEPPREEAKVVRVPGLAPRRAADEARSVVSDPLPSIRADAQESASRTILVVDGVVHVRVFSPFLSKSTMLAAGLRSLPECRGVSGWFHDFGDVERALADAGPLDVDPAAAGRVRRAAEARIVDADAFEACRGRIVENTMMSDVPEAWFAAAGRHPHADLAWGDPRPVSDARRIALEALARRVSAAPPETLDEAVGDIVAFAEPSREVGPRAGVFLSRDPDARRTVDVAFPHPEMTGDAFHWYVLAKKDERRIVATRAAVPEVDVAEIRPVAAHPLASFPETLHDGTGFLARSPNLAKAARLLLDGGRAVEKATRIGANETMMDLVADAMLLSEDVGAGVVRDHGRDVYGLAVRRPDAAIRRDRDDEAASRIVAEYVERRIVHVPGAGLLYRCPEPLVVVAVPWSGRPSLSISHSWAAEARAGDEPSFMFRLDAWDEAMEFMGSQGSKPEAFAPRPSVVDPSVLSFDADLWNLKASLCLILRDLDNRANLMGRSAVEALARTTRFLDVWKAETALSDVVGHEEPLVADASEILSALSYPVFDDVGAEWIRDFAATRIDRLRMRFAGVPEAPVEDDACLRDLTM